MSSFVMLTWKRPCPFRKAQIGVDVWRRRSARGGARAACCVAIPSAEEADGVLDYVELEMLFDLLVGVLYERQPGTRGHVPGPAGEATRVSVIIAESRCRNDDRWLQSEWAFAQFAHSGVAAVIVV